MTQHFHCVRFTPESKWTIGNNLQGALRIFQRCAVAPLLVIYCGETSPQPMVLWLLLKLSFDSFLSISPMLSLDQRFNPRANRFFSLFVAPTVCPPAACPPSPRPDDPSAFDAVLSRDAHGSSAELP